MEAEKQKAESGALHQEKTQKFHAAESKVSNKQCMNNYNYILCVK